MTHTDIRSAYGGAHPKDRKAIPLSLYIAIIREKPKAGEAVHKAAFIRLIQQDGYEEYLEAALGRIANMDYPAALQAAFPPSKKEIEKKAADRREERKRAAGRAAPMAAEAKTLITRKLLTLDFVINGKKLGDHTLGELAKLGGLFAKIVKLGTPDQLVRDVISDKALRKLRA